MKTDGWTKSQTTEISVQDEAKTTSDLDDNEMEDELSEGEIRPAKEGIVEEKSSKKRGHKLKKKCLRGKCHLGNNCPHFQEKKFTLTGKGAKKKKTETQRIEPVFDSVEKPKSLYAAVMGLVDKLILVTAKSNGEGEYHIVTGIIAFSRARFIGDIVIPIK